MGDNSLNGSTSTLGNLPVTISAGGTLTSSATADAGAGTLSLIRGVLSLNGGPWPPAVYGVQAATARGTWKMEWLSMEARPLPP